MQRYAKVAKECKDLYDALRNLPFYINLMDGDVHVSVRAFKVLPIEKVSLRTTIKYPIEISCVIEGTKFFAILDFEELLGIEIPCDAEIESSIAGWVEWIGNVQAQ